MEIHVRGRHAVHRLEVFALPVRYASALSLTPEQYSFCVTVFRLYVDPEANIS